MENVLELNQAQQHVQDVLKVNYKMENKRYRFILDIDGKQYFYKGELLGEDEDFYKVKDYKLGIIEIKKARLVARRPIENE